MVVTLPDFSLQKPFCRLLVAVGFLGFSGTIVSQSNTPDSDSLGVHKKESFQEKKILFNVGPQFSCKSGEWILIRRMILSILRICNALNFSLFNSCLKEMHPVCIPRKTMVNQGVYKAC